MACYHPLNAYRTEGGGVGFRDTKHTTTELTLPCGRCVGCRLERSRQWSIRCVHEASLYDHNAFLTLTYSDENIPPGGSLNYRDFQLFLKRLRRHYQTKVRFYMCGEYGEQTHRPHYHAIMFNIDIVDKQLHSKSGDNLVYSSEKINTLWQKGHVLIGDVNSKSAAYVARYSMKKLEWDKDDSKKYESLDLESGEIIQRTPEFSHMSLKPGIGEAFVRKYSGDIFNFDYVVSGGQQTRPPRYYDNLHKRINQTSWEETKTKRSTESRFDPVEHHHARLDVKEEVQYARIKNLQRRV